VVLALGAIAVACLGANWRRPTALLLLATVSLLALMLPAGDGTTYRIGDLRLLPVLVDDVARPAAVILPLFAAGALFYCRSRAPFVDSAILLAAGGALGVILAGDIVSLAGSWLFASVALAALAWSGSGIDASRHGQRFVAIQLGFGFALLVGGVAELAAGGNGLLGTPLVAVGWHRWLILAALASAIGGIPLGAWLTDAMQDAASDFAPALLVLTIVPAAIALLRLFPGEDALMYWGAASILYAAVLGGIEQKLRRLLGYGAIHAGGVVLIAIGLGGPRGIDAGLLLTLAQTGGLALLAMALGHVWVATGRESLGDLGGLGRAMPVTALMAGLGAAVFAAVPLSAGFGGLVLALAATREEALIEVRLALWLGLAGAVLHLGFRVPWQTFFARRTEMRPPDADRRSRWAMAGLAILALAGGIFPTATAALLPHAVETRVLFGATVVGYFQVVAFAVLAYLMSQPLQSRVAAHWDIDWLWRNGGPQALAALVRLWNETRAIAARHLRRQREAAENALARHLRPPGGIRLGQSLSDQLMIVALALTVLLIATLI
jgi:multicomponent Na+:H+ antiporter subunit D